MRGSGIRIYHGTGPWLAIKYGLWNAVVLAVWAFFITAGVLLAGRVL